MGNFRSSHKEIKRKGDEFMEKNAFKAKNFEKWQVMRIRDHILRYLMNRAVEGFTAAGKFDAFLEKKHKYFNELKDLVADQERGKKRRQANDKRLAVSTKSYDDAKSKRDQAKTRRVTPKKKLTAEKYYEKIMKDEEKTKRNCKRVKKRMAMDIPARETEISKLKARRSLKHKEKLEELRIALIHFEDETEYTTTQEIVEKIVQILQQSKEETADGIKDIRPRTFLELFQTHLDYDENHAGYTTKKKIFAPVLTLLSKSEEKKNELMVKDIFTPCKKGWIDLWEKHFKEEPCPW